MAGDLQPLAVRGVVQAHGHAHIVVDELYLVDGHGVFAPPKRPVFRSQHIGVACIAALTGPATDRVQNKSRERGPEPRVPPSVRDR